MRQTTNAYIIGLWVMAKGVLYFKRRHALRVYETWMHVLNIAKAEAEAEVIVYYYLTTYMYLPRYLLD